MLAVAYELIVRYYVSAIPRFFEVEDSRVRIPGKSTGYEMGW